MLSECESAVCGQSRVRCMARVLTAAAKGEAGDRQEEDFVESRTACRVPTCSEMKLSGVYTISSNMCQPLPPPPPILDCECQSVIFLPEFGAGVAK